MPYSVLNVDDREESLYNRTHILRRAGFTVLEAATGSDAIQIAREESPHVVLLDVHLPDLDGVEVCRRIKSDPATAAIQVLNISAVAVTETIQAMALETGADGYLVEPVDAQVLTGTITALIRQWQKQDDLRVALEELRSTKQALAESEDRLRHRAEEVERLMDVAPVAFWIAHDPECVQITGNQLANAFFEAGPGENVSATSVGTRRFLRNSVELKPEQLPMQQAAAKNEDIRNSDFEVVLPSGQRHFLLGNASPLRDGSNQVRGVVGAFLDVTERQALEEQLRESEQRLRLATEAANEAIWEWNLPAGNVTLSDIYTRLYGHAEDGTLSFDWWVDHIHPNDRKRVVATFDEALNGAATSWECNYRFQKLDGRWANIHDRALIARDQDGNALRLVGAMLDTTELTITRQHLRALTGLLPICASCKKIRDRKGAWHVLEAYVRDHSEAKFSHGMCPECAERWYGDDGKAGPAK
jgi:PAS domain S-box-containing protein